MESKLPCLIWKLGMSPFICHTVAWYAPRGCRVTDKNVEGDWQTPGRPQYMVIKYLSVGQMSRFLYQQIALDVLFQMRYDSLPNSNKQSSDSLKPEATPVFTSNQDCFAYCFHSDGPLGSASIPPHFGLPLCNPLKEIRPPYPIWKLTYTPTKLGMVDFHKPFLLQRNKLSLTLKRARLVYPSRHQLNFRCGRYRAHNNVSILSTRPSLATNACCLRRH